jgi:diguanylate cyclase (GGDEF)-like protein/PAS domain S-box-containing protein
MKRSELYRSHWFEPFLQSSHIGILVVDSERKILFVNHYLCSLFGYEEDEVLYKSTEMFHLSHEAFLAFFQTASGFLKQGKPLHMDYPCRHKDGRELWMHISGDLVENQQEILWTIVDITQRVEAEREIVRLKERMELAIEANRDVVWDWDLITKNLYVSPKWREIVGHDSSRTPYEIKSWRRYLHPEDRKKVFQDINDTIAGKRDYLDNVHRIRHQDGHWLWIQMRGKTIADEKGNAVRMIGTHRDVTATKRLQVEIAKQAQIIEQIRESVISVDMKGTILTWNSGSEHLFGYCAKEVIGKHVTILFQPKEHEKVYAHIDILKQEKAYHLELLLLKKSQESVMVDLSVSPLYDEKGMMVGMIGYMQDITARKEAEEALLKQKEMLHHQANHDTLTQLPNRMLFQNRLEAAILKAKRNGEKIALFFIDLDHFKEINDSLGHDIGDEVLKAVSQKLKTAIREADTLARLGGDEFTIILEGLSQTGDASRFAAKIIRMLSSVIKVGSHELYVSSSIGISIYPDDGSSAKALLKYADAAMFKAKEEGRNTFQFYNPEMTKIAYRRVRMEAELRDALKENAFSVYYQPQINGKTGRLIGLEALVRWHHPERGLLLPKAFIDLAIETGLIVEIDSFVMRQAMKQFVLWYHANLNPGILTLNLSARQLYGKHFIETFRELLAETGCEARWIELEITEDQLMKHPEQAIDILHQLATLGISLTIDDFGLGYSSFAYLQKLPVGKVKIDRTFIQHIPKNKDDISIVRTMIMMAKNLHLDVIAEGVSTEEQKDFIVENGCNNIQGYYYSKALSQRDTEQFLRRVCNDPIQ